MSEPEIVCRGGKKEKVLCDAVADLLPLYACESADRADSVLGDYPNPTTIIEAQRLMIDALLPGKMSPGDIERDELGVFLIRRLSHVWRLLRPEIGRALPFRRIGAAVTEQERLACGDAEQLKEEVGLLMEQFMMRLPKVRELLLEDVRAAYEGDPAALTYAEVQLAYPGVLAIASHRLAHELYELKVPVVPRIMSEWTHSKTGIDIHPGATIGHGFFVDHGTGVVIGETCRIGNHVKVYQGVTLGARSFPMDENGRPIKHVQRHPTVEDNVVIYANATILGGDTVIGRGATVGGNVFLMDSVPSESYVVNEHPELRIKKR